MQHRIRSDILIEALRRELLAGSFGADQRLRIDEIASRHGVSHMPVREALRELAGEGLVILEPNRGARARRVDIAFVRQLFDTRIALEVMLARQAATQTTEILLAALLRIEEQRRLDVAHLRFDEALAGNARLHQAIYRSSGNDHACDLVDRHWRFIAALWARYGHAPSRFEGVENDHRHILRALAASDEEAIGVLVAAHVTKARQELVGLMAAAEAVSLQGASA
jgi:DNA-binding GntR family transcriptional regulator